MQNYQRLLDKELERLGWVKKLLLHVCCAPCSSYVLEYLSEYFEITVLFYNPNISEKAEFEKRLAEEQRLVSEMPLKNPVSIIGCDYIPDEFFAAVKGLENEREGGRRCYECYRLRLAKAADMAKEIGADYFTTTLSISPLKNAEWLNEIGAEESERVGVPYLFSDFKKKNGYKRSIELSEQYKLYRQNFCGCVFSKRRDFIFEKKY